MTPSCCPVRSSAHLHLSGPHTADHTPLEAPVLALPPVVPAPHECASGSPRWIPPTSVPLTVAGAPSVSLTACTAPLVPRLSMHGRLFQISPLRSRLSSPSRPLSVSPRSPPTSFPPIWELVPPQPSPGFLKLKPDTLTHLSSHTRGHLTPAGPHWAHCLFL